MKTTGPWSWKRKHLSCSQHFSSLLLWSDMTSCDIRLKQSIVEALFSTWPFDTSSYDLQKKGHTFFPMMNILGMEIPPKKKRVLMSASFLPTACAHWCFHGVPLMGCDIICLKKPPKSGKGEYKLFDSVWRVCPQCVWVGVVERVTNSFLSLLPRGSHHTCLSMKVMFGGWKQY